MEAEQELKEIEAKLDARNYLYYDKNEEKKALANKNDHRVASKVTENQKKELNKDNKVQLLEQIMKKNFSQGYTNKRVTQI